MRAFPGGSTQKDAIIASFSKAIAASQSLDSTQPSHISLMASVVEGGDPRAFESTTGMPGSLGFLGDLAIGSNDATAREVALAWIAAPAPGADLSRVPNEMVLWILDRAAQSWLSAFAGDLSGTLAAVRRLHSRQLAGEDPSRSEWSQVRSDALAATDAATDNRLADIHKLVETLAWPPLTSRTILADGARIMAAIAASATVANGPVGEAERTDIQRTMEALYAETAAQRDADPDTYFFPDLFDARMPEMSARFRTMLNAQNGAYTDAVRACGDYALNLIRAAPTV